MDSKSPESETTAVYCLRASRAEDIFAIDTDTVVFVREEMDGGMTSGMNREQRRGLYMILYNCFRRSSLRNHSVAQCDSVTDLEGDKCWFSDARATVRSAHLNFVLVA